jgi:hypothetical protein
MSETDKRNRPLHVKVNGKLATMETKDLRRGKKRAKSNPSNMPKQSLIMVKWMRHQRLVNMKTKFPRETKRRVKSKLLPRLKWFLGMRNWKLRKMRRRLKEITLAALVIQVPIRSRVLRGTVDESLIEVIDSPIEFSDVVPNSPDQIAPDVPQAGSQNEKASDEQDVRSGRLNTDLAAEIPVSVIGDIITETLMSYPVQNVTPTPSPESGNEAKSDVEESAHAVPVAGTERDITIDEDQDRRVIPSAEGRESESQRELAEATESISTEIGRAHV